MMVAARLVGIHPQTLRKWCKWGYVRPARTTGNVRLFSNANILQLQKIKAMVDDGVSHTGVQTILAIVRGQTDEYDFPD